MIEFPDVSNNNSGYILPVGTPALIAKSTEGTTFVDPLYAVFQEQAKARGAYFGGYHWLHHGNIVAQATFAFLHCRDAPIMIDAEDTPSEPGYNGPLTLLDIQGFASAYHNMGGVCKSVYLPHWYWQNYMGSPYLGTLGLGLISSNYSGSGGWDPYGGVAPFQWQYTATPIDMNRYKGTAAQWFKAFQGQPTGGNDGMARYRFGTNIGGDGRVYVTDGLRYRVQPSSSQVDGWVNQATGTPIVDVTALPGNWDLNKTINALCGVPDTPANGDVADHQHTSAATTGGIV